MARKAATEEGPVSASKRLFDERRKAALAQAKEEKRADVGLFGDIFVPHVPPDPAIEEPPHDERPSEEDLAIERAYQESAGAAAPEDVAAVQAMTGAEEDSPIPSAAEALAASDAVLAAAEDAELAAVNAETFRREDAVFMDIAERIAEVEAKERGFVADVVVPLMTAIEQETGAALELPPDHAVEFDTEPLLSKDEASRLADEALLREVSEPLGPDSFGGSDDESHLMAQTSAAKLLEESREYMAGSGAGEVAFRAVDATESSPGPAVLSQPEGFSLFGENLFGEAVKPKTFGPLSERFKWPPFTIFDARQGPWQDRKRAWIGLGIQSEVGRAENLLGRSPQDVFSQESGLRYKEAREIYAKELAEQGKNFDMQATILKYRGTSKKARGNGRAFGQDFVLGAQPGVDGKAGGQGKAWHTNDTGLSRKLAPGGGGGGAWLGGPKTESSDKFGRDGEAEVVLDANGNPLAPKTGTSIFDPVLTELLYSWFCPPSGMILDPFAGGSVRGIVAAKLQRIYVGIELRAEQIVANEAQATKICAEGDSRPVWIEGDSTEAKTLTDNGSFDFLMACPPYGDLELYSEDPRDLSTMTWEEFSEAYRKIIAVGVEMLKPDRFACFVIGDIRDEDGFYRGLPELTVRAFEEAGARKYNEAILVTSIGSLPIRIGKQFNSGRKLGKTHQNVLVFVKGDPKRAAEACGGQLDFAL